jgi:hypothetical protein
MKPRCDAIYKPPGVSYGVFRRIRWAAYLRGARVLAMPLLPERTEGGPTAFAMNIDPIVGCKHIRLRS